MSNDQFSDALTLANIAVATLLDEQQTMGTTDPDAETDSDADTESAAAEELSYRAELFQAQGMVMVQIGGTISAAMARMRAYAYAEDCRIDDVARSIVARKLTFDQDH